MGPGFSPLPSSRGNEAPDVSVLPQHVDAAVKALLAGVEALGEVVPRDLDGPQAAVVAAAIAGSVSRLGVVEATMLPVVEADGLWAVGGARSFAHWLAREHRVAVRTARAQVRLGRALRDDLPATAAAGAAGDITLEHAQVLATFAPTTELRRETLADPEHPCNEAFLVEQAKVLPVDGLRMLTRHWAAGADPDADDRGYVEAGDREYLELSQVFDGYYLKGQLTVEHGQSLIEALRAVTPVPAKDDERTSTQRRAQALADLARLGLDHGLTGTGRSVRPRVNVHVEYPTLQALVAAAQQRASAATAAIAAATPRATVARGAVRVLTPDMVISPALTAKIIHGEPVILGPHFEDRTPIPRALLDKLACDSEIARFVFGPKSEILDVGRAERTFTGHLRAAIVARDKHCQYPTCTAPPALSECHHVRHWSRDHGDTAVSNAILLCWYHHDYVHRRKIEIHHESGLWVFTEAHGRTVDPSAGPDAAPA